MAAVAKIPDSLDQASKLTRLDDKTFAVTLSPSFCVGLVPNGGYVATVFLRVANAYLSPKNQPDTISAHWEFLNRTEVGPAVLIVEEVKPGRSMTVLHVSLYQGNLLPHHPWITSSSEGGGSSGKGKASERVVSAYLTNRLIQAEKGITLSTGWSMPPALHPVADFAKLAAGLDPNWEPLNVFFATRVTAMRQLQFFHPRHVIQSNKSSPNGISSKLDMWVRMASGEPFTSSSIGFVVDATPAFLIELYRPPTRDSPPAGGTFAYNSSNWYPTLTLNVEVKKALPAEGEEWLLVRSIAKQVLNGRYDAEVIVFDAKGDLVALTNHVAMIVDSTRNSANRETIVAPVKESKI